ncbi:MAG: iron-sulfur cluster insertion protein ErpA [Pseudomonadota bacterium]
MDKIEEFSLSDSACKRLAFLIAKRNDQNVKLRVSVEGGGCAGFQYAYNFVTDEISEDDLYIERDGAKLLIDRASLELVKGSILDFVEDLNGAFFQIKNPNAASGCGCGNSFSV